MRQGCFKARDSVRRPRHPWRSTLYDNVRAVHEAKEDEKRRKEEELYSSSALCYTAILFHVPHCRLANRISLPAWAAGANSGPEREAHSSEFVIMKFFSLSSLVIFAVMSHRVHKCLNFSLVASRILVLAAPFHRSVHCSSGHAGRMGWLAVRSWPTVQRPSPFHGQRDP